MDIATIKSRRRFFICALAEFPRHDDSHGG
jgi:hypothetical protein